MTDAQPIVLDPEVTGEPSPAGEQIPEPVKPPKGWGKTEHVRTRDPRVSLAAKGLYSIIVGRKYKNRDWVQVRQEVLATDAGVSVRTLQRHLEELQEVGWISIRYTRGAAFYDIHSPEEGTTDLSHQLGEGTTDLTPTYDRSVVFIKQELMSKTKASKQAPPESESGPQPIAAAADFIIKELAQALPTSDPMELDTFIGALPARLRPAGTPKVDRLVEAGLSSGWTATALAQAVAREVPNPNAGAGMAITALEALVRKPPTAQHVPSRPASDLPLGDWKPIEPVEPADPEVRERALAAMRRTVRTKASA